MCLCRRAGGKKGRLVILVEQETYEAGVDSTKRAGFLICFRKELQRHVLERVLMVRAPDFATFVFVCSVLVGATASRWQGECHRHRRSRCPDRFRKRSPSGTNTPAASWRWRRSRFAPGFRASSIQSISRRARSSSKAISCSSSTRGPTGSRSSRPRRRWSAPRPSSRSPRSTWSGRRRWCATRR